MVMVKVRPSLSGASGRRPDFSHSFISALTDKFLLLLLVKIFCLLLSLLVHKSYSGVISGGMQINPLCYSYLQNSRLFQKN